MAIFFVSNLFNPELDTKSEDPSGFHSTPCLFNEIGLKLSCDCDTKLISNANKLVVIIHIGLHVLNKHRL